MTPLESALCDRILGFCFDHGETAFSFVARLAKDNGWELLYALSVLDEYRKFGFLLAAAAHMVVPSIAVDQAWHLHSLFTKSWVAFYTGTLAYPATSLRVSGNDGVEVAGTVRDGHFRVQNYSANF